MKIRNLLAAASMLLAIFAHAQPGDGGPTGCSLGNSRCETKNYPPQSVIPGCSSAWDADCFGVCHKTDHVVTVNYCAGSFGSKCKLTKTSVTSTGTYYGCISGMGKCTCNTGDENTVTTSLTVYRC